MSKVELLKSDVLNAYRKADQTQKEFIKNFVGKQVDFNEKITDRIQSLEDVFELVPPTEDQLILLNYKGSNRKMIGAQNSMLHEMIVEAYNEGKVADYNNGNQQKHFPVFDGSSGFGFSDSNYDCTYTYASVGSRFAFLDQSHVADAAKKFPNVFKQILTK